LNLQKESITATRKTISNAVKCLSRNSTRVSNHTSWCTVRWRLRLLTKEKTYPYKITKKALAFVCRQVQLSSRLKCTTKREEIFLFANKFDEKLKDP